MVMLAGCGGGGSGKSDALSVQMQADRAVVGDGRSQLVFARSGWSAQWQDAQGRLIVRDAPDTGADTQGNPDYASNDDVANGIDRAYPGTPEISYRPWSYLTAQGWQRVTGWSDLQVQGDRIELQAQTSDGAGAVLGYRFATDGSIEAHFRPLAAAVAAVSTAWDSPAAQRYFGGGQRFSAFNLRGTSLPLWISHGPNSNRQSSTNEIAAGFFWCPCGWGAGAPSDARGEINFAERAERDDAVRLMQETDALDVVLYRGAPADIVSLHTARAGRPQWTPPDWMWQPMVWQDSDTSTESVRALVTGMKTREIPLGAVWLDNPWDAGKASFEFDPARFADPDALIREVHEQGVRFMVWLSPFVNGPLLEEAAGKGWMVTGTRPDGNDATYYPERGIDPHLDFTHPDAVAWWQDGLRRLIRRGVDGVKVDRGEEDLSDDSVWHNGMHNRLNHNAYVDRYHRAIFESFKAERPDGDFTILARGGWNGSGRWSGHWAADNTSLPGDLGLGQALRSLLSLSVSGFPFNGSDIGGYAGMRQDMGESAYGNPLLLPTEATYMRWTQLGAFSPSMQTPVPPWWVTQRAIDNYRRYAVLHDRLVPYIAAAAKLSVEQGVPIVRPMPYAYPDDADAIAVEDQYLFGPDLLVAPITQLLLIDLGVRSVYLPAGRWRDFWTGETLQGPQRLTVQVPSEQIPLYVREGAQLPPGVAADQLP